MQFLKVSKAGKSFYVGVHSIKEILFLEEDITLKLQGKTLSLPMQDTENANYNNYAALQALLNRSEVFDDPF